MTKIKEMHIYNKYDIHFYFIERKGISWNKGVSQENKRDVLEIKGVSQEYKRGVMEIKGVSNEY